MKKPNVLLFITNHLHFLSSSFSICFRYYNVLCLVVVFVNLFLIVRLKMFSGEINYLHFHFIDAEKEFKVALLLFFKTHESGFDLKSQALTYENSTPDL